MNDLMEQLIEALRDELQQYGEMLALLDRQQDLVLQRATDRILENLASINAQTAVIEVARRERERRRLALNEKVGLTGKPTFTELCARLPGHYAGLIGALVDENNQCLTRVRSRTRQNHLLLSRSLELVQRFVAQLFPAQSLTTYNQSGRVASMMPHSTGTLSEVAG
jgi:flagellar biosynthesis/type III secretory pathway chaperone